MLKPKRPNFENAQAKLDRVFPHVAQTVVRSLRATNQQAKGLPPWRESQLIKFIKALIFYANDLNDAHRAGRIDKLATTARNLAELGIWVRYCNLSEKHAFRFYEDSVRDFREMLEAIQRLYTAANGKPEDLLTHAIDAFQQAVATSGIEGYGERYTQVRAAAKELGKSEPFSTMYKIFSKMAHPTSLVLTLELETGTLSEMLDSLYDGGENFAVTTFEEIVGFVNTAFESPIAASPERGAQRP